MNSKIVEGSLPPDLQLDISKNELTLIGKVAHHVIYMEYECSVYFSDSKKIKHYRIDVLGIGYYINEIK